MHVKARCTARPLDERTRNVNLHIAKHPLHKRSISRVERTDVEDLHNGMHGTLATVNKPLTILRAAYN